MPQSGLVKQTAAYRFGEFRFNATTLELTGNDVGIRLQRQPARLLKLLLENAGDLVTREAIQGLLWKDGINVDFEMGVNRCIRQLRTALMDDAIAPRYIKTASQLGYSFIAPTTSEALPATPPAVDADASEFAPSIAVLPFANFTGDPQGEYFSDGLTEEIINVLAQTPKLKVKARTSAFAFKGKNADIRQIAAELEVDHVVEGSVRRSDGQIRVTVQLIQASSGTHLSSRRYDGQMTDIFALQDEIAADVARQFHVSAGASKRSTLNTDANEAYLEGRFHWHKYAPVAFNKALICFERAVALDAACAPAWTGIAQCSIGLVTEAGLHPLDHLPKAAEAARRALDLDDNSSEAHACLGQITAMLYHDWLSAARHFERALSLHPSSYVRLSHAGWYLFAMGRAKDAVLETERIIADDPLNLVGRLVHAMSFFFARDFDRAAEEVSRLLEMESFFPKAIQLLSVAQGLQGRFRESIDQARRLIEMLGNTVHSLWCLAQAYAVAGDIQSARRVVQDLDNLQAGHKGAATQMAILHGLMGDMDKAFVCLDQAYQNRSPLLTLAAVQPRMDCLRSDPRFDALLIKLNLPRTAEASVRALDSARPA